MSAYYINLTVGLSLKSSLGIKSILKYLKSCEVLQDKANSLLIYSYFSDDLINSIIGTLNKLPSF